MQLLNIPRGLQVHYQYNLCRVHHQPLIAHHVTQQDSKGNAEDVFLQIQCDLVSATRIQHEALTCYMVLY